MPDSDPHTRCPACGAANRCAIGAGRPPESCWCRRLEARLPLPSAQRACFCPRCLERFAKQEGGRRDR